MSTLADFSKEELGSLLKKGDLLFVLALFGTVLLLVLPRTIPWFGSLSPGHY